MNYSMKDENIKVFDRFVQPPPGVTIKILQPCEEFILEDKFYTNQDQSIILRSTNATGKLIRPKTPKSEV